MKASYHLIEQVAPILRESEIHSIIEVGCGNGHFVRCLNHLGFNACGAEDDLNFLPRAQQIVSTFPYGMNSLDGLKSLVGMFDCMVIVDPPTERLLELIATAIVVATKLLVLSWAVPPDDLSALPEPIKQVGRSSGTVCIYRIEELQIVEQNLLE